MLRSVDELKGYTIEATDGDVGEVVQFYFDDEKWTIRYLVADTGGWLPGRKVLISPGALGKVDWNLKKLHVSMTKERVENSDREENVHLRSTQEVTNYYIEANDGDIGHVDDFLVDDENWTIRYVVVDTRNWWPGKKVLISPEWIRSVSWTDSRVFVDLSRDSIKNGPEYDPSAPLSREYENRLYNHYGRSQYWNR